MRANVIQLVERLLASLDLEAKVRLLTGASFWTTHADERIGLRSMVFSDGPAGVRGPRWDERDPTASLPSPTALAATWDEHLVARLGGLLAAEARRKQVDVLLAPTVNLHRSPLGGRHFECLSEDPLLSGRIGAAYVRGLQDHGVAATAKHYVANDPETNRFTVNVRVDERTLVAGTDCGATAGGDRRSDGAGPQRARHASPWTASGYGVSPSSGPMRLKLGFRAVAAPSSSRPTACPRSRGCAPRSVTTSRKLVERAPWVLNPEWTPLTMNQTLATTRKAFEGWYLRTHGQQISTSAIDRQGKRPDFVMLGTGATIQIVEIKRPLPCWTTMSTTGPCSTCRRRTGSSATTRPSKITSRSAPHRSRKALSPQGTRGRGPAGERSGQPSELG